MLHNLSNTKKNIIVFILIALSTYFEMEYLTFETFRLVLSISIGVSFGFFMIYGYDVLPGIVSSTILFRYLGYALIYDSGYTEAIPLTFLYFVMMIISLISCYLLFNKINAVTPRTVRTGLAYVFFISIVVTLTSIPLSLIQMNIFDLDFMTSIQNIGEGSIAGILIFGTLITFAEVYDIQLFKEKFKFTYLIYYVVIVAVFTLSLHHAVKINMYVYLTPIMMFIFIIHAFYYNYRYLFFTTMTFVYIYALELEMYGDLSNVNTSSIINLLLLSVTAVVITVKALFDSMKSNAIDLEDSNDSKESIMNSMFTLFKVHNIVEKGDYSYTEAYMKNVFKMTTELFTKVKYSLCIYTQGDDIIVVDSIGYTKEEIKSWNLQKNRIIWNFDHPLIDSNPEHYYKSKADYYDKEIKYNNSIRFVIPLGNNEFGGITLDATDDYSLTKTDFENISYLQKLLITFYEKNELVLKTTSLKDDIVLSLIRTLELYDQYTGGHSEDVAVFSKMIAEEFKLSDSDIYNVYWAGIVHDIGKIGIDPLIINKPSKLTEDEYLEIKKHSLHGYSILKRSKELKDIAVLVRHHHEWYNGTGYPDGLKQDQIPFLAQILAVADSVSSMATKRPYQKEKTKDAIIKELKLYSGVQFNPEIVTIMINLLESGKIDEYYSKEKNNEKLNHLLF